MRVAPEIKLTEKDRKYLRQLIRKGESKARVQTRARILLMADSLRSHHGGAKIRLSNSNETIGAQLGVCARTVSRVRQIYQREGLQAALGEQPRSGRPVEIDGKAEAHLITLACSDPPEGRSQWTLQLLADRMVELGYVEHISDTWVSARLKKTNFDLGGSKAGVSRK
jgi:putative transposase